MFASPLIVLMPLISTPPCLVPTSACSIASFAHSVTLRSSNVPACKHVTATWEVLACTIKQAGRQAGRASKNDADISAGMKHAVLIPKALIAYQLLIAMKDDDQTRDKYLPHIYLVADIVMLEHELGSQCRI